MYQLHQNLKCCEINKCLHQVFKTRRPSGRSLPDQYGSAQNTNHTSFWPDIYMHEECLRVQDKQFNNQSEARYC